MKTCEKWGDSVESAVQLACEELNLTPEDVDIEILEEPSRGFFGLGSKLALVRVSAKEGGGKTPASPIKKEKITPPPVVDPVFTPEEEAAAGLVKRSRPERHPITAPSYPVRSEGKNDRRSEIGGRKGKYGKKREKRDYQREAEDLEPVIPAVDPESLTEMPDSPALLFIESVVEKMGLEIKASCKGDDKTIYIYLEGADCGTVIGKRGITLDALQYLTSLAVNKGDGDYKRVVVDAENYRAKRAQALERLALSISDKVCRTGRSFRLEPMNPYERKVIHSTLQRDERVLTRSEGQDPYRRVVVELK